MIIYYRTARRSPLPFDLRPFLVSLPLLICLGVGHMPPFFDYSYSHSQTNLSCLLPPRRSATASYPFLPVMIVLSHSNHLSLPMSSMSSSSVCFLHCCYN